MGFFNIRIFSNKRSDYNNVYSTIRITIQSALQCILIKSITQLTFASAYSDLIEVICGCAEVFTCLIDEDE